MTHTWYPLGPEASCGDRPGRPYDIDRIDDGAGDVMQRGLINVAIGLFAVAVGIAVTVGSYAAVAQKGGHYFIAWGAVVFGAWRAIVGLVQLVRGAASAEGRASLVRLLWPSSGAGRALRLAILPILLAAGWVVAPESWTTLSAARLLTLQGTDEIKSMAYAPGGRWLAAAMGYGGLRLWNATTGETARAPAQEAFADIEAVAFSPDGRLLAAATHSGLRIWSSSDWDHVAPTLVAKASDGNYAVAFSPDGASVATGSISKGALLWDARTATIKWASPTRDSVSAVAFSPDGAMLAAGHSYGEIKLWDAHSGALLRALRDEGLSEPATTLAFFRDGRLAAGSYRRAGVTVWDTRSGSLLRSLQGTSSWLWPAGHVWSIAISPDDKWIAAGNTDRSVRFWNPGSEAPARSIFGHGKDVLAVAFSPDGAQLASGGADDVVNIWAAQP